PACAPRRCRLRRAGHQLRQLPGRAAVLRAGGPAASPVHGSAFAMTQALPPPFDALDLPPPWPEPLLEAIRAHNNEAFSSIVVLDDDPLGGQCVRDVPVLTDWHTHDLASELEQSPAFMLLTNTRSLPRREAVQRAEEIGFA